MTAPDEFEALFGNAGATDPEVNFVADQQGLRAPSDWWTIALGSGFRWEIEQLGSCDQLRVKDRTLRRLSDHKVTAIEISALHAVARKPG